MRSRLRVPLLLSVVGALLTTLAGFGVAAAQDDQRPTQIIGVEATNVDAISVTFRSDSSLEALAGAKVSVDGKAAKVVSAPQAAPADSQRIVLMFEASTALDDAHGYVAVRDAAKAFVEANAGQQISVYSVNESVRRVSGFSTDTDKIIGAMDTVGARPGNRLWDSITNAARVLDSTGDKGGTVVVIAGTADDGSAGGSGTARGALAAVGARLSVVGYETEEVTGLPLQQIDDLVQFTAGALRLGDDPEKLSTTAADAAADAANLFQMTFQGGPDSGVALGQLEVGGEKVLFEYGAGRSLYGASALIPTPPAKPSPLGFFGGTLGKMLGLALVTVATVGVVYSLALIFTRDNELSDVLAVYTESFQGEVSESDASRMRNAIVQRAVDLTEQVAESQGFLTKIELMLEQASMPLRAAEALFFYLLGVIVMIVVGSVMIGFPIGGLFFGILGFLLPPPVLNFKASRRKKRFMAQLPDTLQLLAGTLRAGFSLMQGVEAVSQEVDGPMGEELRRVVTEARLGRSLEEALDGAAERMGSQDFAWAVMAISIQREVGGNLAELLLTVSDTMIQRERLRGEISALTAEGRISAIVLGLMPPALGVVMFTVNPDYMSKLFTDTLGNILLGISILGIVVGLVWMKKIIEIDI